ncbi:MAG: hypothetical protein M0Z80_13415 [Treponema sp.]|nr:hypothetical protein [Treponema sp.]
MKKFAILAAIALAFVSCVTVSYAPQGSVFLGARTVGYRTERGGVGVGNYDGWFRALYFEVEQNDIELYDVVVVYGNGQRERLGTRLVFDSGSRSRIIPIEGGRRRIRAIEFSYRTVSTWADGKARILVYGIR